MKRFIKRAVESGLGALVPMLWRARSGPALLVLMYHRVLPPEDPDRKIEQPGMFVSPRTLDLHLTVLREYFEIVHLDEWLRRESSGKPLPPLACALTFDDGWQDNYEHAFPVLVKHSAPATIFLVSTLIGTTDEFWPNRLARVLSSQGTGTLPRSLQQLLEPLLSRKLQAEYTASEIDFAIRLAKAVPEADIRRILDEAESAGVTAAPRRAVLNETELRAMAESGLVRYGSHTRTHYRCREPVVMDLLVAEIDGSRRELVERVQQPVELFCYPNGDTTPAAVELVSRTYAGAVTTQKGWYRPGENRFLIPRIGVHEDISNTREGFIARISGWL